MLYGKFIFTTSLILLAIGGLWLARSGRSAAKAPTLHLPAELHPGERLNRWLDLEATLNGWPVGVGNNIVTFTHRNAYGERFISRKDGQNWHTEQVLP